MGESSSSSGVGQDEDKFGLDDPSVDAATQRDAASIEEAATEEPGPGKAQGEPDSGKGIGIGFFQAIGSLFSFVKGIGMLTPPGLAVMGAGYLADKAAGTERTVSDVLGTDEIPGSREAQSLITATKAKAGSVIESLTTNVSGAKTSEGREFESGGGGQGGGGSGGRRLGGDFPYQGGDSDSENPLAVTNVRPTQIASTNLAVEATKETSPYSGTVLAKRRVSARRSLMSAKNLGRGFG